MARSTCILDAQYFANIGLVIFGRRGNITSTIFARRFRSQFGISPVICARIWNSLGEVKPNGFEPKHLLWGLLFLKVYSTESVHATIVNTCERTFRKWSWKAVDLLAAMKTVGLHFEVFSITNFYRHLGILDC